MTKLNAKLIRCEAICCLLVPKTDIFHHHRSIDQRLAAGSGRLAEIRRNPILIVNLLTGLASLRPPDAALHSWTPTLPNPLRPILLFSPFSMDGFQEE